MKKIILLSALCLSIALLSACGKKITFEEAKEIALQDAGKQASEITFTKEKVETRLTGSEYEFEFVSDDGKWEYKISGDGTIQTKAMESETFNPQIIVPETETAEQGQTSKENQIANPMVEITDSKEFEKQLGISIDASKLYSAPKMFIIDGKVADIIMEETNVNGEPVEYRLRATKDEDTAAGMHGIFDELIDIATIDMDYDGTKVSIEQKETKDQKTTVHTWKVGDVYYSLTIDNHYSQMQYAEVMDSIFAAIGVIKN